MKRMLGKGLLSVKGEKMLEKLFLEMIAYYSGDPKRIQHFTKVHSYAKLIGEREQLSPEELYILEAAAYTPRYRHQAGGGEVWKQ